MERFSASAQQDDLKGTVAIDTHDMKSLYDFAKDNGIDTERYIPVGITFWKSPNDEEPTATVITVDSRNLNHGESFENVTMFIDRNDPVPVKKFALKAGMGEFFKYCKRVSISVTRMENLIGKELSPQAD